MAPAPAASSHEQGTSEAEDLAPFDLMQVRKKGSFLPMCLPASDPVGLMPTAASLATVQKIRGCLCREVLIGVMEKSRAA